MKMKLIMRNEIILAGLNSSSPRTGPLLVLLAVFQFLRWVINYVESGNFFHAIHHMKVGNLEYKMNHHLVFSNNWIILSTSFAGIISEQNWKRKSFSFCWERNYDIEEQNWEDKEREQFQRQIYWRLAKKKLCSELDNPSRMNFR